MIFMHLFQSRRGKYSHLNTTTYLCLWTNSCHRFIHSRLCNLEWLVGESTIKWKGNRFPVYRRLRLFHKLFMYSQTFPQCVSKTKEFYWECTAFLCLHSGSCGRQTHTLTHSLYIFCCCMDKFFFFFLSIYRSIHQVSLLSTHPRLHFFLLRSKVSHFWIIHVLFLFSKANTSSTSRRPPPFHRLLRELEIQASFISLHSLCSSFSHNDPNMTGFNSAPIKRTLSKLLR